jgi:metal-sulfur cluster biosynthetic enzyme
MTESNQISQQQVIEALKKVEDPELFLDIWFLGLVYSIDIADCEVLIEMTFTTPMCPAGPQLVHDVQTKVGEIEGVKSVNVKVVFTPPWKAPDEVRDLLGIP